MTAEGFTTDTFYHLDQIRSLIDLKLFMWMNGTNNMDFADPL